MSRDRQSETFWSDFRRFFLRGLSVLLPTVLTLWLLFYAYRFVDGNVAEPINRGLRMLVLQAGDRVVGPSNMPSWMRVTEEEVENAKAERRRLGLAPAIDAAIRSDLRAARLRDYWNSRWWLRIIGLVVAIVLIYTVGRLLGGFFGRSIYARFDVMLSRAPVFKLLYPHVKQVVEFIFGENPKLAFKSVVLIEYPRKGVWTIGLATSSGVPAIEARAGRPCLTVFIPSSPTPFTGWTITVPRDEAHELDMTIDEALRFVVTGGVLGPERPALSEPSIAAATNGTGTQAGR